MSCAVVVTLYSGVFCPLRTPVDCGYVIKLLIFIYTSPTVALETITVPSAEAISGIVWISPPATVSLRNNVPPTASNDVSTSWILPFATIPPSSSIAIDFGVTPITNEVVSAFACAVRAFFEEN